MSYRSQNVRLDVALNYTRQGWSVLPIHYIGADKACSCGDQSCQAPGKHPIIYTGENHRNASIDQGLIKTWWSQWPEANIAVVTGKISGLVILDVDPRNGGKQSLASLEEKFGNLPTTPEVRTGGGGLHKYFVYPDEIQIKSGKLGGHPGIDIKSDGGYIIAPPSIHISGKNYEWDVSLTPYNQDLAPLPDFLINLLTKKENKESANEKGGNSSGWICEALKNLREGNRNDTFCKITGKLCSEGWNSEDIIYLLIPHAEKAKFSLNELSQEVREICNRYGIENYKKKTTKNYEKNSTNICTKEIEPWPKLVDGLELFQEIKQTILVYVKTSQENAIACALWVFFTHAFDCFDINPRLIIESPEKRCGKTTLLSIIGALVPHALSTSNLTVAALFRAIDKYRPTLLIDEADSFTEGKDELRGVLNSGHMRNHAYVMRCGEKNFNELKIFCTWAPIAMAAIGKVWDSLEDRAIVISLKRKMVEEKVKRMRGTLIERSLCPLCQKLVRWVNDNKDKLKDTDVIDFPEDLDDRAVDNWTPLISIADLIGVGREARNASKALAGGFNDDSIRVRLLQDLVPLFKQEEKWATEDLIKELVKIEESPWGDWMYGKPISPTKLANLLKPFCIKPKQLRINIEGSEKNKRGYEASQFDDAFRRYIPPQSATNVTTHVNKESEPDFEMLQHDICSTSKSPVSPHKQDAVACAAPLGVGEDEMEPNLK